MKWTKRLKWLKISKIVIPIALAISIIFAGFTVYAHKAENFVVRINNGDDVKLALTMNDDLSGQTSRLVVPIDGRYSDETYTPNREYLWGDRYGRNLPDDIARQSGIHSVYRRRNEIAFFSFSFWLVNNSNRAVDVDINLNIDEVTIEDSTPGASHIDDAVRVMFIEGERPLLSDETYVVYKKPESDIALTYIDGDGNEIPKDKETRSQWVNSHVAYGNTLEFESDKCVFSRTGERGIVNLGKGETRRFTIAIWLEGHDLDCIDEIRYDSLKLSMDFQGY